jgi:5'-deoxynucleotidase YfbR-like HD superfamily hydrolase
MHDAAEAYIGDIPTPLKNSMGSYRHIENVIEDAISERYGLREDLPEEVKTLDLRMFATEARDLTLLDANEWRGIEPFDNSITPWAMSVAEQRFLYMFEKFNRGRGGL